MKKNLLYIIYLPLIIVLPATAAWYNCKRHDNSPGKPADMQQVSISCPWQLPGITLINNGYLQQ